MTARRLTRAALALGLAAAGLGVSGCMIDEDATMNPAVMETPDIDTAREANYPRGSAQPNPDFN